MSIILADSITVPSSIPLDAKYGPYATTAAANAAIPTTYRYVGLTVGIGTTTVADYWYNGGIANGDLIAKGSGGGSGTVTSVSTGSGLSGGPITTTGTISLATAYGDTVNPYASKTANYFLAAPNGSAGAPTFRAIVASDIPKPRINLSVSLATNYSLNSNTYDIIVATGQTGSTTISVDAGSPFDGQKLIFRLKDASGGTATITFATGTGTKGFRKVGTTIPASIAGSGKTLYVGCIYNANDVVWDIVAVSQEA
jgi:hypothetical protein